MCLHDDILESAINNPYAIVGIGKSAQEAVAQAKIRIDKHKRLNTLLFLHPCHNSLKAIKQWLDIWLSHNVKIEVHTDEKCQEIDWLTKHGVIVWVHKAPIVLDKKI